MPSSTPTPPSLEKSDFQGSVQRLYSSPVFLKHGTQLMDKAKPACVHCPSAIWISHAVEKRLEAYCQQMHRLTYHADVVNDPITDCDGREAALAALKHELEEGSSRRLRSAPSEGERQA